MVQVKQFSGVMNLDDQPDVLPFLHHMEARNIVFRGNGANKRAQNIPGNVLLPNAGLPLGTNVCIGAWYDQVKGRIFSFIYNSNNNHGIYIYTPTTGVFQTLIKSGTNTVGDVLQFDIKFPILNVNIIYGDSTQGDVLYWLNSQKKPCKINIDRALTGDYGVIEVDFLDVATAPPSIPPYVVYEDDATITVNNLRKKLFKFKIRYVYDDNEKSTTSIQSEIPLPYNPFDPEVDADATLNSRIAIVYTTGPGNVKKIEILAALSLGNNFSDFFLVTSIDKEDEQLEDNDIAVFNFYNNQAYNYIDLEESIQLFDYVPLQAVAQELLNGNTLMFGNITEGYPNLTNFGNGTNNSSLTFGQEEPYEGRYFSLLVANQGAEGVFGTTETHFMVKGRVTQGNIYTMRFTTDIVTYTAVLGDDITDVLDGLISSASGLGFTVTGTSATPDSIYIFKVGQSLQTFAAFPNGILENIDNSADGSLMAYDWWSRYSFGLVYRDKKGRTNGVVYPASLFAGQTIPYADFLTQAYIPKVTAFIYHRPPIWAYDFTWVRTKNLSKSTYLQWISNITFKDNSPVANEQEYAYIGIESVNVFKSKNTASPLSYSFSPNDRIRFIKRYEADGSALNQYTDKDFEVVSSETNPTIGGIVQTGQFVKIKLPTTDASFDFGGIDYAYYFIELYTPAQSVANGLDVYYEFGERYKIGNAGTVNAYHEGEVQNQTSNLVSPAIYNFIKGDGYLRYRVVSTGSEILYTVSAGQGSDFDAGRITIGATPTNRTLDDPNLLVGTSPSNNIIGLNIATNDDRWIVKIVSGTYNLRAKGIVTIQFMGYVGGDTYEVFLQKNDGTKISLGTIQNVANAATYYWPFDVTFQMTSGQRLFIFGWSVTDDDHERTFIETQFTITDIKAITQTIIDPNFSDFYPSAVNSNGRAFVFDENANTVNYPTLMRWGLSYEPDTNINRSNRFYAQNFDEVDRAKGQIQRFKARQRILRVFQERGCGQVGVYTKFIQDSAGQQQLTTTDEIITRNNIQYYLGEYGLGRHPESLVSATAQDYFVDPIRGYQVRLSNDGLTPISEIYKGQYYIRGLLTPYNKVWNRPDGSYAKILGVFDYLEEEYIAILQSGSNVGGSIGTYTFAFNERENAYSSFRDYIPEWMVCAEEVLYSWLNGNMFIHNSSTYCNFFGSQYNAYIDVPFNENLVQKKTFMSVAEIANTIWEIPLAYTNLMTYGTQRQETNLKPAEFAILEQMPSASFKRDIHSPGGKINGWSMKGNYLVARFQVTNASELVYLSAVSVKLIDSPLTAK